MPSLSVGEGPDGRVLLHCHAGCEFETVLGALGLEAPDLFPRVVHPELGRAVAVYSYLDESGRVLFQVCRFQPKGFRPRRPDGTWTLDGVRLVPYRLPDVVAAVKNGRHVYVVEGEKDADRLDRAGVVATTNAGGAGKWRSEYAPYFQGADVVLVADRDDPGYRHVAKVAATLAPVAKSVRVVEPKAGKDAADHLDAGHGIDDFVALADGEDSSADEQPRKATQVERLVKQATAVGAELFHTPDHVAYATFPVGLHRETHPIRGKAFRLYLRRLFYERDGKVPGSQAVADACGLLEGMALFDGAKRPVFVRLAAHEDAIYLDLGNDAWETVVITRDGWWVTDDAPVRFRRARGLAPLPHPEPGGSLDDLRPFLNVTDDDWPLVLGFLVAMVRPTGPYPVLNVLGAQGSGKSTDARVLRDLVDPNTVGLRAEPRDMRDLAIAATNGQVVALDNLSRIPDWLSDAICRLASGGGFATRELYSDDAEALFAFVRPVILTGIEELAVRGDLLDRSILTYLPAITEEDRRDEAKFWAAFEAARPRLLGAVLDAVSTALRRLPDVELNRLPRMADFALWVTAAAPALGLDPQKFMDAYERNRQQGDLLAVEASPVAAAVLDFMKVEKSWAGTATELLELLNANASERVLRARTWPKAPNVLAGALRRVQPHLHRAGVTVSFDRPERGTRHRIIKLERVGGDRSSPPSPPSPSASDQRKRGDDQRRESSPPSSPSDRGDDHGDGRATGSSPPNPRGDLHKRSRGDDGDDGDASTPTLPRKRLRKPPFGQRER